MIASHANSSNGLEAFPISRCCCGVSLQKRGFQKALILGEKRESEIKKIKKKFYRGV